MTITVLILFVPVLVMILLLLNVLLAVHKPDTEKVTPYESVHSVQRLLSLTNTLGRVRWYSLNLLEMYYLVGILFLIFDLEIAVFYPLAVTLYQGCLIKVKCRNSYTTNLSAAVVIYYRSTTISFTDPPGLDDIVSTKLENLFLIGLIFHRSPIIYFPSSN
ncbi:uncharacterized protein LOC111387393 [Olea europaea var. sylvestris]|uniref:uncharacterized protein LOC111387393 n=1 Tax=Olea europaea var. sylvestris TaxID=158386 RepID=UPI000C1D599F|nr:uncharacterized protein LOC111387393 [Olea europaea var. sylvestris]